MGQRLPYVVTALYSAVVGFFMFESWSLDDLFSSSTLFGVMFWAFAISPVAILCLGKRYPMARTAAGIGVGAFGIWAYYDTLYVAPPDAQSALIFLFAPVYQFVIGAVAILTIALVGRVLSAEK